MTIATHTTPDGWTLRVFSTMYLDYGIEILDPSKEEAYYSPCALSCEAYGRGPSSKYESWDEAEDAELDGDEGAFVEWTQDDWIKTLASEANELIEAFVEPEQQQEGEAK